MKILHDPLLATAFSWSCLPLNSPSQLPIEAIVARVGGEIISETELNRADFAGGKSQDHAGSRKQKTAQQWQNRTCQWFYPRRV